MFFLPPSYVKGRGISKKIKIAAIPILCLVSPLFLIDNVIQELLYNRLQLVYLVNDCTLRLF